jgi:hypothetical protein
VQTPHEQSPMARDAALATAEGMFDPDRVSGGLAHRQEPPPVGRLVTSWAH